MAFLRVEDQSVLPGYLHQPMEIQIVLLSVFAVDNDVIRDADGARALTQNVIHGLLEGVSGHAQDVIHGLLEGVSDSATKNSAFCRLESLYLHGMVMTPCCLMIVLL